MTIFIFANNPILKIKLNSRKEAPKRLANKVISYLPLRVGKEFSSNAT